MAEASVLYDADCGFCRWSLGKLLAFDRRRTLRPVALQDPEADTLLGEMGEERKMASWHLVTPDGQVRSAGAAVGPLLRFIPGGRPFAALAEAFPRATDRVYWWVAANRGRLGRLPLRRGRSCARRRKEPAVGSARPMTLEQALRRQNRAMIAFDLALGTGTVLAPRATLWVLGHDRPRPETEELFRRLGPIWLTFAAAHALAATRGRPQDWWALAWLRGTEVATDAVWSRSPAFRRPGARLGLKLAGVSNLAMALGFGYLAARGSPDTGATHAITA
jgi:predicted DCC family thiol-disulfide oxidoreductase YuxK